MPQVKLLLAAVDQLAADGLAMSQRLRQRAGGAAATTADVVRAAGQVAGAAAAQMALEQGQEAGGAPAAASKAATVLLEAAGMVAPGAQLQDLEPDAADGRPASTPAVGRHSGQQPAAGQSFTSQLQQQQQDQEHTQRQAHDVGRLAAELSSMQVLVVLPYAEVLCFADVWDSSSTGAAVGSEGHRWVVEHLVIVQCTVQGQCFLRAPPRALHWHALLLGIMFGCSSWRPFCPVVLSAVCRYPVQSVSQLLGQETSSIRHPMQPQPQPQQQNLLTRWASRVAPVADLVLSGLRIGTNSGFQGGLSAKLELSSGLLVNLQLLDLCKSPATCASAAGVYLPNGYAVPSERRSSSGPNPAAGAAAGGPACLAANYNAFVLAPYTSRLTAAYESATLHRWQLLGLSRLVADQSQAGSVGAAARGQLRGQGPSCASSGTSAGQQQQQGGMLSRGWISRRQLLRHRWQRVLELRAFVKSMDYAMFLVFHQAAHQGAAADPVGTSSSGSISACEPGASTPAEQYQMLYRMYLAELEAAAATRQPAEPQRGWFGSRRSTRANSVGGVPLYSAPAAATAAAASAAAAAASAGSSPAAASAATAGSLPGSPSIVMLEQGVCDWRRGHMRDTFWHRLSTAERAQSAHSSPSISRDGSSGSSAFYGHILGGPLAATSSLGSAQLSGGSSVSLQRRPSAAPVKLRDGSHSFNGADVNGLPPVAERAGSAASRAPPAPTAQQVAASRMAAKAAAGALPVSTSAAGSGRQGLRSDSFSSDGSSQPAAAAAAGGSPMAGMQMFNALRSLRSGSSFLLGAAAQQLRLIKRQGQQQQQQQHPVQQQQHPRAPSRLGPRPFSLAAAAAQEQHSVQSPRQQQLPQGWHTQGVSSFAAAGPLFSEASLGAAGQAHSQQQQQPLQPWEVMLDFLSAFAVFEDFLNRPVSTAAAGGGGFRVLAPSSRQPQLSLSFLQQPATGQQQRQQVEPPANAAAAAALGRERTLAAQGEALDDQLTLGLGHLKMVLGPHSVSMGLQLMTSLLGATAARQANPHSTSSSRHGKAQPSSNTGAAAAASPATPSGGSGSSSSRRPGTGLNVRLQLAVCHVAFNMERMAAADRVQRGTLGGSRQPQQHDLLETKGLLSLLLLDANSSVQRRPAAAGSAGRGAHAGGMRVSCSVAHAGLQDLCAPLEQRHVLSGSREPYRVSWMSRFLRALFRRHAMPFGLCRLCQACLETDVVAGACWGHRWWY